MRPSDRLWKQTIQVRCFGRASQSKGSQKLAYVAQIILVNGAMNHIMLTSQLLSGKFSKKYESSSVCIPDDSNICTKFLRDLRDGGNE
jgi:hypothetical protein